MTTFLAGPIKLVNGQSIKRMVYADKNFDSEIVEKTFTDGMIIEENGFYIFSESEEEADLNELIIIYLAGNELSLTSTDTSVRVFFEDNTEPGDSEEPGNSEDFEEINVVNSDPASDFSAELREEGAGFEVTFDTTPKVGEQVIFNLENPAGDSLFRLFFMKSHTGWKFKYESPDYIGL